MADAQICTPDRGATLCMDVTTHVEVSLPSGQASVERLPIPPTQPDVVEAGVGVSMRMLSPRP